MIKFISNNLIKDYGLSIKPRERFPIIAKDIDYLLYYLFNRDYYNFKYKRVYI